jgi:hypothetical protein
MSDTLSDDFGGCISGEPLGWKGAALATLGTYLWYLGTNTQTNKECATAARTRKGHLRAAACVHATLAAAAAERFVLDACVSSREAVEGPGVRRRNILLVVLLQCGAANFRAGSGRVCTEEERKALVVEKLQRKGFDTDKLSF